MSEMIERVARALYSEDPKDWDDAVRIVNDTFGGQGFMSQQHPDTQGHYKADMDEAREKARRAIESMREPTMEMVHSDLVKEWPSDAYAVWHAMIDEALK